MARSRHCSHPKVQRFAMSPAVCFPIDDTGGKAYFVLCKARMLCYTLRRANPWFRLFLGSSAVEHSTVNRMVAGSNPARGAIGSKSANARMRSPDINPRLANPSGRACLNDRIPPEYAGILTAPWSRWQERERSFVICDLSYTESQPAPSMLAGINHSATKPAVVFLIGRI